METSLNITYQNSFDSDNNGILSNTEFLAIDLDGDNAGLTVEDYIKSLSDDDSVDINLDFDDNDFAIVGNPNFDYTETIGAEEDNVTETVGVSITASGSAYVADEEVVDLNADCYNPSSNTENELSLTEMYFWKDLVNSLLSAEGSIDTRATANIDEAEDATTDLPSFRIPTTISFKDDIIDGNVNLWDSGCDSEEVLAFLTSDESITDDDIIKYFGEHGKLGDLESIMGAEPGSLFEEYNAIANQ